jgi:hypothetical protein
MMEIAVCVLQFYFCRVENYFSSMYQQSRLAANTTLLAHILKKGAKP